jgi:hypothetical protein
VLPENEAYSVDHSLTRSLFSFYFLLFNLQKHYNTRMHLYQMGSFRRSSILHEVKAIFSDICKGFFIVPENHAFMQYLKW